MSNIYNNYWEQAREMALEYGLSDFEAQSFATEAVNEAINPRNWQEILIEAVKYAGGNEYQDYKNEAVLSLNSR